MLLKEGYEAECADNGEFGLKLLMKKQFDLIVTEILMPEKDGIEIIYAIRNAGRDIPIFAISAGGKIAPEYYLELALAFGAGVANFSEAFKSKSFSFSHPGVY